MDVIQINDGAGALVYTRLTSYDEIEEHLRTLNREADTISQCYLVKLLPRKEWTVEQFVDGMFRQTFVCNSYMMAVDLLRQLIEAGYRSRIIHQRKTEDSIQSYAFALGAAYRTVVLPIVPLGVLEVHVIDKQKLIELEGEITPAVYTAYLRGYEAMGDVLHGVQPMVPKLELYPALLSDARSVPTACPEPTKAASYEDFTNTATRIAVLKPDAPKYADSYDGEQVVGYQMVRITPRHWTNAYRWFESGDHPDDNRAVYLDDNGIPFFGEGKVVRYFRRPDVDGESICELCERKMHDHGWIDGGLDESISTVCPGDWIVQGWDGTKYFYYSMKSKKRPTGLGYGGDAGTRQRDEMMLIKDDRPDFRTLAAEQRDGLEKGQRICASLLRDRQQAEMERMERDRLLEREALVRRCMEQVPLSSMDPLAVQNLFLDTEKDRPIFEMNKDLMIQPAIEPSLYAVDVPKPTERDAYGLPVDDGPKQSGVDTFHQDVRGVRAMKHYAEQAKAIDVPLPIEPPHAVDVPKPIHPPSPVEPPAPITPPHSVDGRTH